MNILKFSRLLAGICLLVFAWAFVESKAEVTYCTFCCNLGCEGANGNATPTPTPTSTPTPTPTPTLPPPDAVVAPSGGDYTSIGAAYAAMSCGDLIYVRNGSYTLSDVLSLNKTCSSGNEITIRNYPGESPEVVCANPANGSDVNRVQFDGQYNVWDGIEISNCWDGFKIHNSQNKVLNSNIHNNLFSGIVISPLTPDIVGTVISGNTIEVNGYVESGSCGVGVATNCTAHTNPTNGQPMSIKHVQQVYFSNSTCNDVAGGQVDNNIIRNFGGRALQFNGLTNGDGVPCSANGIRNIVFEDNAISGGSVGIAMFFGITGVSIRDNVFIMNSWPTTNDTEHYMVMIFGVADSDVVGNEFTSSSTSMRSYYYDDDDSDCNDGGLNMFNLNTFDLNTNDWQYNGSFRTDFSTAYTSVTGCGADDVIN